MISWEVHGFTHSLAASYAKEQLQKWGRPMESHLHWILRNVAGRRERLSEESRQGKTQQIDEDIFLSTFTSLPAKSVGI